MKICISCKKSKILTDFYKNNALKDSLDRYCKECSKKKNVQNYLQHKEKTKERVRKWNNENKDKRVEYSRRFRQKNPKRLDYLYKYKLTEEAYLELLYSQKEVCAGCETPQSELKRKLFVDHCHKTGIVRGLLCDFCNRALGDVKDNPAVLRTLANYLENAYFKP